VKYFVIDGIMYQYPIYKVFIFTIFLYIYTKTIQNRFLIIKLCFGYFVYIYMCKLENFLQNNKHRILEIKKWQKELYHPVYSQEKTIYPS
jgi:hypothetical protein